MHEIVDRLAGQLGEEHHRRARASREHRADPRDHEARHGGHVEQDVEQDELPEGLMLLFPLLECHDAVSLLEAIAEHWATCELRRPL